MAASANSRQYPTAYKLKASARKAAKAFCLWPASLRISRKLLHDWIKAWKAHGPEG